MKGVSIMKKCFFCLAALLLFAASAQAQFGFPSGWRRISSAVLQPVNAADTVQVPDGQLRLGTSTTAGFVPVADARGVLTMQAVSAAGAGDITAVTAGVGLNGGGTTGAVTVNADTTSPFIQTKTENSALYGLLALQNTWTGVNNVNNGSGGIVLLPFNTGAGQTTNLRFMELAAGGTNYLGWKAPDAIATNKVYIMPRPGSAGQVLTFGDADSTYWSTPTGGAETLDELTDVDITSAATGNILMRRASGAWVDTSATLTAAGGWQDDGTDVRLITTTDEVVIGATTPISSAKFSIDGDLSTQIQMVVQGAVSQDNVTPIFKVESSGGVDKFVVLDKTGTTQGDTYIGHRFIVTDQDNTYNFAPNGNNTSLISRNSDGKVGLQLGNTTTVVGGNNGSEMYIESDESFNVWNYENTHTIIATNNIERIRIASGGNVGIGQATHPCETPLHVIQVNAPVSSITRPIRFHTKTSGAQGQVGLGTGISAKVETQISNNEEVGALDFIMTDVTSTTEDADFSLKLMTAGAGMTEKLKVTSLGNATISGGLSVGGGTIIPAILKGSAALDFTDTVAGTDTDLTITVTGADDGDPVFLGIPNGAMATNRLYFAWVSASNTVTVRFRNLDTLTNQDPDSATFNVTVFDY